MKKVYITTPIYYPNDSLHLGHAYSTIIADVYSRFRKLMGDDVYFLTGTDEHGQKIEKAATKKGLKPQELVDINSKKIKTLWSLLNIEYDQFIRTTSKKHIDRVKEIYKLLDSKNNIYKSFYTGPYCIPCETFFTKKELNNSKCPICNKDIIELKIKSFYFMMSKYQNWVKNILEQDEILVLPKSRKKEIRKNFLEEKLQDLAITRDNFSWGIRVDEKNVLYVWVDALFNYLTALGFPVKNEQLYSKYWEDENTEKIHIIGKEITRFHCIYWPIFLHTLNLNLPNKIIAHGWITSNEQKMSKSIGNVLDPISLIKEYGSDYLRYFLIKYTKLEKDFSFDLKNFILTINSDLSNNIGNMVSRVFNMIIKYFEYQIPKNDSKCKFAIVEEFKLEVESNIDLILSNFYSFGYNQSLAKLQFLFEKANKLIEQTKPWILFKENKLNELSFLLSTLVHFINWSFHLLSPILINSYYKYQEYISWENIKFTKNISWKSLENKLVKKPRPIFERFPLPNE